MANKYSFINNLELLKARKPRKPFRAQAPDNKNFLTSNVNLKRLANFGLSMMQFLPDFERLSYAGKIRAKETAAGRVPISFGTGDQRQTIYVTPEWYESFTRYGIGTGEDVTAYTAELGGIADVNGNGRYDNFDTISWWEGKGNSDGFGEWRGATWIDGKAHGVSQFDGSDGTAGQDIGANFKNIDFLSNDGNFIHQKGNTTVDDPTAAALADQSYFLDGHEYDQSFNFMGTLGISWEEIQGVTGGKSFYNMIMDGSYQSLNARQATMLVAYMFEMRERAWQSFSEVLGPVQYTRNDEAMMNYVEEFISESSPYANSHALTLFPLFLYFQHSTENRLTTYFEQGEGQGWEASVLSSKRFWRFVNEMGRSTYNNNGEQNGDNPLGKLYEYRATFYDDSQDMDHQSARFYAVNTLIEKWFGATKVENGRPLWEGYHQTADGTENGEYVAPGSVSGAGWFDIPSTNVTAWNGSWVDATISRAYVAPAAFPGLSWDRKWSEKVYVDVGGTIGEVYTGSAGWADVLNNLWQQGSISSRINPLIDDQPHPQYAVAQVNGLSLNTLMAGAEFSNNWVVHAMGMLMKYGVGQENVQMMERSAQQRQIARQFTDDSKDYAERAEELAHEATVDERIAMKKLSEARAKQKKPQKSQVAKTGGSAKPAQQEYLQGSKEFARALNKLARGLIDGSKKRKELLAKLRQDNAPNTKK